ncbi:hypothetical protein A4A49_54042 [Nicotiana attenuata]|uniref:Uncharacterized protein n=1 Tax=Nicotiana attenuata TaxID=49451 RepID=A0A314KNH3_NICAT|nr:hypothetical protein A4A49_54042 [Nicotiana attenuata]
MQDSLNQRQFNSILTDLRFTISPAPFRCTIGDHATHGDLSIDRSEGPPLNKFLKDVNRIPAQRIALPTS